MVDLLTRVTRPDLKRMLGEIVPHLDMEHGPWIAGGCLHRIYADRTDVKNFDIDVFCVDRYQQNDMFKTLNHITSVEGLRTQVVYEHLFPNAQAVIDDFDFTVCQLITDGKTLLCGENTLEHIRDKKLRLNPKSEVRAAYRVSKYCGMGYEPDAALLEATTGVTGAYYSVEPMEVADDLELDFEYTEMMRVKSSLADLWVGEIKEKPYVFFKGHPMPLRLAYPLIGMYLDTDRRDLNLATQHKVVKKYLEAWKTKFGFTSYKYVWEFARDSLEPATKEKVAEAYSWICSTT